MSNPNHESIVGPHNSCGSALRELAGPRLAGDPIKAAVHRAARLAGLEYWRAYDIWYGRARRIDVQEETQITQALQKKRIAVAHNEFAELRARMARLETLLLNSDEDFHREDIAAIRFGNRGAD